MSLVDLFADAFGLEIARIHAVADGVDLLANLMQILADAPASALHVNGDVFVVLVKMPDAIVEIFVAFEVKITFPVAVCPGRGRQRGEAERQRNDEKGIFHRFYRVWVRAISDGLLDCVFTLCREKSTLMLPLRGDPAG